MNIYIIISVIIILVIYCIQNSIENFESTPAVNQSLTGIDDANAINTLAQISTQLMAGGLTVPGNINILGNSTINGKSTLTGDSTQKGNSTISGNLILSGNSTLIGDSNQTGNSSITGKFDVNGNIKGTQLCIGNTCIDEIHLLMLVGKKTLGFNLDKSDVNGQNANGGGSYLGACGTAPCAGGATVTATTDINRKTKFFMTPM